MSSPLPYSRKQLRIEARLRRFLGDGSADFYLAAVQHVPQDTLSARSNLVWHCAREIESALFWVLAPMWGVTAYDDDPSHEYEAPDDLAFASDEKRSAQVASVISALELDPLHPDLAWWTSTARLHKKAHRRALAAARAFDVVEWARFENVLDLILDAVEAHFGKVLEQVDELLAKGATATSEDTKLLCRLPLTSQSTAHSRFFQRADASWLTKLPKCLFATPPGPMPVATQPGYVTLPVSPLTQYLARMSADDPEAVYKQVQRLISQGMPDSPWVQADLADISKALTPKQAGTWADLEAASLRPLGFFYPGPIGHVVEAAASVLGRGQADPGFALAIELLALAGSERASAFRRPATKLGEHEYEDAIASLVPAMSAADPNRALDVISSLMEGAFTQLDSMGRWTRLWLDRIDTLSDHPDVLDHIGAGLRDAALVAAEGDPDGVVAKLWGRSTQTELFRRLALHVISKHPAASPALDVLACPNAFTAETAPEAFDALAAVRDLRGLEAIAPCKDALSASSLGPEQQGAFAAIFESSEVVDSPYVATPRYIGYSPKSPIAVERLASMPTQELVDLLRTWQPEGHAWETSRDALAAAFEAAVSSAPVRFSRHARDLAELPPPMLERLVAGASRARPDGGRRRLGTTHRVDRRRPLPTA